MESIQDQIRKLLINSGIPAKEVKVYGSQIMVTAFSRAAAEKWAHLIGKFATFKSMVESMDYCKENKNTVMIPSAIKVWRVWGTI